MIARVMTTVSPTRTSRICGWVAVVLSTVIAWSCSADVISNDHSPPAETFFEFQMRLRFTWGKWNFDVEN